MMHQPAPATIATPRPLSVPNVRLKWRWRYLGGPGRDLRFDLVRGACVLGMICNHVAGSSWARIFSLSNGILITPAEGFVFISGFVFGMVFRPRVERHGLGEAMGKGLGRTWILYRLTLVLTLLFGGALFLIGMPSLVGLAPDPLTFALDVVVMHRTIYLVDVIMLYTFLTAAGSLALWFLVRGKMAWLLSGSFALWLAYQLDPQWASGVPWTIGGNDLFHIAAWQLPFIVAMTLGYHQQAFMRWFSSPRVSVATFGAASIIFALLVYLVVVPTPLQAWVEALSQKQAEGPVRLLACLFVFQFVRLLVTYLWRPLQLGLGWLLLPLGQNSLYAYVAHLGLIAAMWQPIQALVSSEAWSTGIQLGTVLVVWYLIKKRFLFRIIPR
jgi:hypothetical protein